MPKVFVLMVGYEIDIVRVFTSQQAMREAIDDYPGKPIATEEVELEEAHAEIP